MDQPERTYANASITVEWYPGRCLHTGRCIAGLPDVFDPQRRPWIQPEDHTADEIAEVVQRCPTGALHFRRGQSEHKPFCDNTHRSIGFRSGMPATDTQSAAQEPDE